MLLEKKIKIKIIEKGHTHTGFMWTEPWQQQGFHFVERDLESRIGRFFFNLSFSA